MKKGKIIGIISIISALVLGIGLGIFLLLIPKNKPTYSVSYVVGDAINSDTFANATLSGQLEKPSNYPMSENMYFDGWYLDRDYLNKANFPLNIEEDVVLYAKYLQGNLPSSNIAYNDAKGEYYICGKLANVGITTLVIPDIYNDGTNGIHKLTYIENVSDTESLLTNNQNVKKLYIGNNIDTINEYFAYNSACIESVTFGLNVAKIAGTAFKLCVNINDAGFVSDGWYNVGANDLYNCELEWLQRTTRIIKYITYIKDDSGNIIDFNNATDKAFKVIEFKDFYILTEKPAVLPIIPNYMLVDWYWDEALTDRAVFPTTVTEDTVLYPKMLKGTLESDYYTYTSSDGGYYSIKSSKYSGSATSIVIPDYYNNDTNGICPVTKLVGTGTSSLLYGNTTAEELWIGNNITKVPSKFAYYNDASGTSYTTIFVGRGVTSIGTYAFRYSRKLKEYYFYSTDCENNTSTDLVTCMMGKDSGGCNFIIGDNVTTIPKYVFGSCDSSGHNIFCKGDLYIPDSVESIGYGAFLNCEGFDSITIGQGVTSIGNDAFKNCVGVTSLIYKAKKCSDFTNSNTIFNGLSDGVTLTIGENVEHIPAYLFYSNASILSGSIVIPDSVTTIGTYAFYYQDQVTSLTIGEGVLDIGNRAFAETSKLTHIQFNAIDCTDLVSENRVFLKAGDQSDSLQLTIGNNVQKIPEYLFFPTETSGLESKLKSIVFAPNSVCKSIGNYAFNRCYVLNAVEISDSVEYIGYHSFEYCSNMTSLTLGSNVATIDDYAFSNCGINGNLIIPDSVTTIGEGCFLQCDKLESLTIGKNVKIIEDNAFYNCTGLSTINYNATSCNDLGADNNYVFYSVGSSNGSVAVTIGANVKRIPAYLFYPYSSSTYRPRITTVIFEDNSECEYIGRYAFRNCTDLSYVDFGTNTSGWWVSTDANATSGTDIPESDLTNTTTAKTRLVTTYYNYYWWHDTHSIRYDANGGVLDSNLSLYGYIFDNISRGYVVENSSDTSNYGFSLNGDGYYESSNKNVSSTYSLAKVSFSAKKGDCVVIQLINNAEPGCDFGIFSKLNTDLEASNVEDDSSKIYKNYSSSSLHSDSVQELRYNIYSDGDYYFYVKYIKDGSGNYNNNSLQFKLSVNSSDITKATTTRIDGYPINTLPVPKREGYTFLGWSTTINGTEYIDESYLVSADIILYAQWKLNL